MTRRFRILVLLLAAGALAVPATPAVATDPPPSVTLTSNHTVYIGGQTATFTSKVVASNLDYVLQVQFPGSAAWKDVCASQNVNTDTFTCDLAMYYNVHMRAQLIDDHGTPNEPSDDTVKATATESVPVRASMETSYGTYIVKSGRYAVYGAGTSPSFVTQSGPAFPGKRCLRHQVQRRYASGWRTVKTSVCKVEGSQGQVYWTWGGRHPSRVNFRVRGTFAGDVVNASAHSAWIYFTFR
ncbi:MAG: hypothetical protein JWQ32_59 [Marmoricola sp.]|nr:hypothetical protein [Marmoricola sp.]